MTSPLFSEFMRGYLPLSPHVSSGLMTPLRRRCFWSQHPPYPLPSTYRSIILVSYCYLIDYFVNNSYSLDLICTYDIEDFFKTKAQAWNNDAIQNQWWYLEQDTYFFAIQSTLPTALQYKFNMLMTWIPNLRIHNIFLCNQDRIFLLR